MSHPVATELSLDGATGYRYTVCTLVDSWTEYRAMVDSFVLAGFAPAFCEYLYIDNSETRKADAYGGCNAFLNAAQGQYIILCHQDVLASQDRVDKLEACIRELDQLDPSWALLGNAGCPQDGTMAIRLTDPGGNHNSGRFPIRVRSLDENFILVKRSANLCLSHDLRGFHLYGTDLCLLAGILGRTAWAVDFALHHKSRGTTDLEFLRLRREMMNKYRQARPEGLVATTCTVLSFSSEWASERASFKFLYDIRKGRYPQARSNEFEARLQASLGNRYLLHWFCYKLGRPWQNLKAFVARWLGNH